MTHQILLIEYLKRSNTKRNVFNGLSHGMKGFDGLIKHLEHRTSLELRIFREVLLILSTEYRCLFGS